MNENFNNIKPAGLEEQPTEFNKQTYMEGMNMDTQPVNSQNVDAIVNGISFLGNAYNLGKGLIGKKFNIFDFKTDLALVQEAKAGFNFVGTLPQIESELVDTITPEEAKQISDAVVALNLLKPGTSDVEAVSEGIALAVQIKNYCQKYF
jgi:hypothetical protein